jgi:Tol biopolymer transport system component
VDIWTSQYDGSVWSTPTPLDSMINTSASELQPAFTNDGDTMYFVSDRSVADGPAIYRSHRVDSSWSTPQLVIRGIVGEPSLTADGQLLYFVHVLTDTLGLFDADIWYCERK